MLFPQNISPRKHCPQSKVNKHFIVTDFNVDETGVHKPFFTHHPSLGILILILGNLTLTFPKETTMKLTLVAVLAAATVGFASPLPQSKDCPSYLSAHEWHPHPSLCSLFGYGRASSSSSTGSLGRLFGA
jgi:hypothetical protein